MGNNTISTACRDEGSSHITISKTFSKEIAKKPEHGHNSKPPSKQSQITPIPGSHGPQTKCQFFRIKPIAIQEVSEDKNEKKKRRRSSMRPSINPKNLEEVINQNKNQNKFNADQPESAYDLEVEGVKIPVNWGSFIKIKKKNYLDDYIHVKQIGKGAYGSVSKVKMKYGEMFRAAKVVKDEQICIAKDKIEKFLAEIKIPMKTDHPNLNKLFEVFQWNKKYVMITELCEGGDLFEKIRTQKIFSESRVADIMKQILSGVSYLHSHKIVHRDLKPENMLYDNEGKLIKITDFGTAVELEENKTLEELAGSSFYVAPQVLNGQYNEKCDVWSCGVILYILLCGSPPFYAVHQDEIFQKIKKGDVKFQGKIWNRRSLECKALIKKMLIKNYKIRPSAYEILNSQWIKNSQKYSNYEITQESGQLLTNLSDFHFKNKLKAVVYTYIASQLYSSKERQKLLALFKKLDKDGNGVIAKQELLEVFKRHKGENFTQIEAEKIINLVDTNGSGKIDFTEFLVAASNEEELLQKKKLEDAFAYLDNDHSGYITADEILPFLDQSSQTEQQLKKIFQEVDANGDGKISKKQFIALLIKKA